jgi:hypothetical protein
MPPKCIDDRHFGIYVFITVSRIMVGELGIVSFRYE